MSDPAARLGADVGVDVEVSVAPPRPSLPQLPHPAPSQPHLPTMSQDTVSPVALAVREGLSPAVCGPVAPVVKAVVLGGRALQAHLPESSVVVQEDGSDNSNDRRPVSK